MNYLNLFDFSGKVVMITGAGGSLGQCFASAFASCGANIAAVDIDYQAALNTSSKCQDFGVKAVAYNCDVTKTEKIENLLEKISSDLGLVDILCNHAGMNIRKPSLEYSEKDWDTIVSLNLKASFFVAQAVGKTMVERGIGRIINTASVSAARGHRNLSIYAATKGGIAQYTKVLAHEWAEHNVTVNAIGPGYILTNQTRNYFRENPEIHEKIISMIPIGRLGDPEEIASVVLFLASPGASYITGQTIYAEGGRMID